MPIPTVPAGAGAPPPLAMLAADRRTAEHHLIEAQAALDAIDAADTRLVREVTVWMRERRRALVAVRDAIRSTGDVLRHVTVLPRGEAA